MRWACVFVALALTGCAPHMIYLRADGINPVGDPVVNQQFSRSARSCQRHAEGECLWSCHYSSGIPGVVAAANRSNAVAQVGQG